MRVFVLACWMISASVGALGEGETRAKIEHLDASGGNIGDHQIVYITHNGSEKLIAGTALVVLRKSGKHDIAYGYTFEEGTAKVGIVTEKWAGTFGDCENSDSVVTIVEVTESQYKATKSIIDISVKNPNRVDGPAIVFYNNVSKILRACDMKIPYRSAYRTPNPAQWVGDIPAYSRDLVIKQSPTSPAPHPATEDTR